ncbi:MAG: putative HTH-type transcriptional regulator YusO [Actinomycetota bacterium]|jgi:DNA-binding MarR family transcriptional regulator
MASRKLPTEHLDRLNRDGYIFLNLLAAKFGADIDRICSEYELNEGHYRVLWVLCLAEKKDPLAMGDIVDGVINKASDITRLVDKLVRLGLVERSASPEDKRKVLVKATPEGRRVFAKVTAKIKAIHYDQWKGLNKNELTTLVELLKKALSATDVWKRG